MAARASQASGAGPSSSSSSRKFFDKDAVLANLSSVDIGAEGCKALAEALKANTSLQTLDLSSNSIGAEGGKALAEALQTNRSLEVLRVDESVSVSIPRLSKLLAERRHRLSLVLYWMDPRRQLLHFEHSVCEFRSEYPGLLHQYDPGQTEKCQMVDRLGHSASDGDVIRLTKHSLLSEKLTGDGMYGILRPVLTLAADTSVLRSRTAVHQPEASVLSSRRGTDDGMDESLFSTELPNREQKRLMESPVFNVINEIKAERMRRANESRVWLIPRPQFLTFVQQVDTVMTNLSTHRSLPESSRDTGIALLRALYSEGCGVNPHRDELRRILREITRDADTVKYTMDWTPPKKLSVVLAAAAASLATETARTVQTAVNAFAAGVGRVASTSVTTAAAIAVTGSGSTTPPTPSTPPS